MTVRRSAKRAPLDVEISELPGRFLHAEVTAEDRCMSGLHEYMSDLTTHLRCKLGVRNDDEPPTVDVMSAISVPPEAWYRAVLMGQDEIEQRE
ncbi:hypothetical protein [Mycolicibacterium hippocampi]|uniref:Uncharacterized protein n=1 Tax=Mycolicibacterium hippocampi TaxID=659824 RepID=A0A7I9ZJF0_9MYCO|nr:hypothetical protein [Mycolicibacterium hippocampi]GFH00963.1 hypothetical protein MHIP_14460 [Mycolicibacterium hippocampi]